MKLTVQLVLHADDDTETIVREVFTLQREDPLAPDTLGLQLAEAKDLLVAVQDTLVVEQVATAVSAQVGCPDCGAPRHKDSRPIVMKTLFGRLRLDSPRWWHCGCQPRTNHTFSPGQPDCGDRCSRYSTESARRPRHRGRRPPRPPW